MNTLSNHNVLISCIMPIYNCAEYLETSIGSILKQTFKNFELICVNDSSSDSTSKILNKFSKNDSRIIIIDNYTNVGAAQSRNIGLLHASGEYVIFIDADDFFVPNMLEELLACAAQSDADLIVSQYHSFFSNEDLKILKNNYVYNGFKVNHIIKHNEVSIDTLPLVHFNPWTKFLKKDFLLNNNIYFQDLPSSNDVYFSIRCALDANKIVILNNEFIFYRKLRVESITNTLSSKQCNLLIALSEVYTYLKHIGFTNKISSEEFIIYILYEFLNIYFSNYLSFQAKKQLLDFLTTNELTNSLLHSCINHKDVIYPYQLIANDILCKKMNINKYFYYVKTIHRYKQTGYKLALWGCGNQGKLLIDTLNLHNIKIDYIIDENPLMHGQHYHSYVINSYDSLTHKPNIIITLNYKWKYEILQKVTAERVVLPIDMLRDSFI